MTFKAWHELVCANFEKCFWVNTEPDPEEESPELIFKRGIYKDTYNATQFWTNTQLRPNFPISMVVVGEHYYIFISELLHVNCVLFFGNILKGDNSTLRCFMNEWIIYLSKVVLFYYVFEFAFGIT